jgi:hypothetical protein
MSHTTESGTLVGTVPVAPTRSRNRRCIVGRRYTRALAGQLAKRSNARAEPLGASLR